MAEKTGIVASLDRFGEGKTFTFAYEVGHISLRIAAIDEACSVISDGCLRHIAVRNAADEVIR